MKGRFLLLMSAVLLVACGGGSDSSGGIGGVNLPPNCAIVMDEISLDSGEQCFLTNADEATYSLNLTNNTISCDAGNIDFDGSMISSPLSFNGLTITCGT